MAQGEVINGIELRSHDEAGIEIPCFAWTNSRARRMQYSPSDPSIWIPSLDESSVFFHQLRLHFFTRIRHPLQDKGEERRPVS
jgi:hypothetical protein